MNENSIIITYLLGEANITGLVGTQIFCPRIPEGESLPAISFFCRGGPSGSKYVSPDTDGSFQFDCWADDPLEARNIYIQLRESLHGVENQTVTISGHDYKLLGAELEVPGIDEVDIDIPEYFKTRAFFKIQTRLTEII